MRATATSTSMIASRIVGRLTVMGIRPGRRVVEARTGRIGPVLRAAQAWARIAESVTTDAERAAVVLGKAASIAVPARKGRFEAGAGLEAAPVGVDAPPRIL